jgi:hypothetical protein
LKNVQKHEACETAVLEGSGSSSDSDESFADRSESWHGRKRVILWSGALIGACVVLALAGSAAYYGLGLHRPRPGEVATDNYAGAGSGDRHEKSPNAKVPRVNESRVFRVDSD